MDRRRRAKWTLAAAGVLVGLASWPASPQKPQSLYDSAAYARGREALSRGKVAEAAEAFCSMLPPGGGESLFTLSVVLLCHPENAPGEVDKLSGVHPVFLETVPFRGQTCYRVCAGLARSRKGLEDLRRRLPPEVLALRPFVVAVQRPCSAAAAGSPAPRPPSSPVSPQPPPPPEKEAVPRGGAPAAPLASPPALPPLSPAGPGGPAPGGKEAESWFRKGVEAYTQGRRQEAESCYREALRADPGKPEVLNNLGVLRLEEKRFGEARELFGRALERTPRYARARLNLAGALWAMGDRDGAVEEALRASELDPADVAAHLTLASFYLALGKKVEARAEARRVLALDPRNEQAQVFLAAAGREEAP